MKRNLNEQLDRINLLSDDKNHINEVKSNQSSIIGIIDQLKNFGETGFRITKGFNNTVKKIQQLLVFLGYKLPRYGVDGYYGPETIKALKNFSSSNSLNESFILTEQDNNIFTKTLKLIDGLKLFRNKGIHVSSSYNPIVKIIQTILIYLGYKLPKFGVDGHFGKETTNALKSVIGNDEQLQESSSDLRATLSDLGYDEKGSEISSGGEVDTELTKVAEQILRYYKRVRPKVNVTVTGGNDKYHQRLSYNSSHKYGLALDFTLNPFTSDNLKTFLAVVSLHKKNNSRLSYRDEYNNPSSASTGGHIHIQLNKQVSTKLKTDKLRTFFISPLIVDKLLTKLEIRNNLIIPPNTINGMIEKAKEKLNTSKNKPQNDNGFITELDLNNNDDFQRYVDISNEFIKRRRHNPLDITGEMIASGAKSALDMYGNYIPPELSLAQLALEGGVGNNNPKAKPIRTRNPFNVGNNDSGKTKSFRSIQEAINRYFHLVARKFMGDDKSASDLFKDYTSSQGQVYATSKNYESLLRSIGKGINKISRQIYT